MVAMWLALAPPLVSAAGRYDPKLRFRSIRTAHFTIHYHQGEDAAAARLATIVEPVRTELQRRLGLDAPRHTHVILVDQDDVANGWSTPFPYNVVELAATPPSAQSFLGHHDDWLTTVFTHEYAHTMHLDQVGGLMRLPRWLLGRHPASFPNLFVPTWQIEGIATYAEGLNGLGRTHAADVAATMAAQRRSGAAPRLDQLAGGLVAWPGGWGPYFYGGAFVERLASVAGDAAIGELARRTARRLPFFSGGAFSRVFGESADTLWKSQVPEAVPEPTSDATRVTRSGYLSSTPRFQTEPGPEALVYATIDAHAFPAIRRVELAGFHSERLTSRVPGEAISSSQGWVIFDDVDVRGAVARVSDLHALHVATGRRLRLSTGARLSSPDVSIDGRRIVATQHVDAERALVVYGLTLRGPSGAALDPAPHGRLRVTGCSFDSPRWSPDGRRVAASVSCHGSLPEIGIYDPEAGTWSVLAPDARARDITPTWSRDGHWLLFASDRGGGPFAIYAVSIAGEGGRPREIRSVWSGPSGATSPDVSPDGTRMAFVGATAQGMDIFVTTLADPASWPPVASSLRSGDDGRPGHTVPDEPFPRSAPYSPWSTLVPRYWEPVIAADGDRLDVGGQTSGSDVLGRHTYWASLIVAADRPDTTDGVPAASRVDWDVSYTYDRWRPVFVAAASGTTDHVSVCVEGTGLAIAADSRSTEFFGGFVLPYRRARFSHAVLLGLSTNDQHIDLGDADIRRARNAARTAWTFSSARRYGYSISPEDGVRLGLTAERTMTGLGSDGRASTFTADARVYLPGGIRHGVLAVRAAAGSSTGHVGSRRLFSAGGPGATASTLTFDRKALGLLRGLARDDLTGTAMVAGSIDYRFPVLRVERGRGAWPLFLNTVHVAFFSDYAAVGATLDTLRRKAWSAGAELSADVTLGFGLRMTATAGAAWTHHDGRASEPGRAAVFVRTGYAF